MSAPLWGIIQSMRVSDHHENELSAGSWFIITHGTRGVVVPVYGYVAALSDEHLAMQVAVYCADTGAGFEVQAAAMLPGFHIHFHSAQIGRFAGNCSGDEAAHPEPVRFTDYEEVEGWFRDGLKSIGTKPVQLKIGESVFKATKDAYLELVRSGAFRGGSEWSCCARERSESTSPVALSEGTLMAIQTPPIGFGECVPDGIEHEHEH